jgi:hypothetical protein
MFIDLAPEGLSKRDLLVRVLWRSDLSGRFKDSSGPKVRPALARRCIAQQELNPCDANSLPFLGGVSHN